MKSTFTIEFVETNNQMIKMCIGMITSGIEDKVISKTKNKVVIDATGSNFDKIKSLSEVLADTGYVKHISFNSEK